MHTPRLRPTFHIDLPLPPERAMAEFRRRMNDQPSERGSRSMGLTAELFPEEAGRRIWSPHLSIQARERPGGGTRLHGRFAPFPEVWTFFVFLYGMAWFAILFGAALGYAQAASAASPWGLWLAGIGVVGVVGIHTAGALGQRWGAAQMNGLKRRFDRIVAELDRAS